MTPREHLVEQVRRTIERCLDDPEFSVEMLAEHVGLSRSRLHRLLVGQIGRPPGRMIRHARLLRAADLLRSTDRGVAEIAASVGYAHPAPFTRSFKRKFGLTPTEWRSLGDETARESAPDG